MAHRRVRTPTLDALAAGGIRFEAAYTAAPLTLPAHVSMLSGRLPAGHTVRTNDGYRVPDGVALVGSRLQAAGYRTAAFVGASVLRRETGVAAGFDHFDDDMAGAAERRAGAVVERATTWLRRPGDGPVFLWVHVYDPHLPYDPPALYDRGGRPYDGEIEYVDAALASLLQQAESRSGAGGLAVIVAADHGEGLGDHGEASHGALLYDETIRVPLIVRRPDGAAAGTTESRPVSTAGVAAAILQFAGAPVDGLVPSILADAPALVVAESMYLHQQLGWSALYAGRDGRWKVIDAPTPERYDLAVDPGERRSLAPADEDATRDAVSRLRRTLAVAAGGAPTVAASAVDAEAARRLAALGYVSGGRVASGITPVGGVNPVERMAVWRDVEAGLERAQAGARDDAAAVFTRVLAADPENVLALKFLGAYAIEHGDLDRGIALNERVLATGLHVGDVRSEPDARLRPARRGAGARRSHRRGDCRLPPSGGNRRRQPRGARAAGRLAASPRRCRGGSPAIRVRPGARAAASGPGAQPRHPAARGRPDRRGGPAAGAADHGLGRGRAGAGLLPGSASAPRRATLMTVATPDSRAAEDTGWHHRAARRQAPTSAGRRA